MTVLQVTDLKVALNLPWTLVGVLMSKVSVLSSALLLVQLFSLLSLVA